MSALSVAAQDYLAIRRALGLQLVAHGRLVEDYVAHLDSRGGGPVTVQTAVDWANADPLTSRRQLAVRMSAARGFARYLAGFDTATQIPPARMLPVPTTRPTPVVFSEAQIGDLLASATRLSPPLRAASFHTLIAFMAATGLRTAEARALDRGDVDLSAGALVVLCSKYGKTRQIPLHPSTTTALTAYLRRRDRLCPRPVSDALLITPTGDRLRTLSQTFLRLLREAAITVPAGHRGPRLHDLRHTFAVATLRDWHRAGLDVQPRLPALSAYLGHVNPAHTYWYLQAVPELMAVLADRLDDAAQEQR
jgi:integrase/recombinase XerD